MLTRNFYIKVSQISFGLLVDGGCNTAHGSTFINLPETFIQKKHLKIYTNKIGDCLFICLSVRLWAAKPQGLTGESWRIHVKSPDDECGLGAVGLKCHLR